MHFPCFSGSPLEPKQIQGTSIHDTITTVLYIEWLVSRKPYSACGEEHKNNGHSYVAREQNELSRKKSCLHHTPLVVSMFEGCANVRNAYEDLRRTYLFLYRSAHAVFFFIVTTLSVLVIIQYLMFTNSLVLNMRDAIFDVLQRTLTYWRVLTRRGTILKMD